MTGTVFNDKNDNDTSGNYNNNDVYYIYILMCDTCMRMLNWVQLLGQRPKMNLKRGRVFRYFI